MHNPSFDSILNELNAVLPKLRHYEIENFISEYYIILTSRNESPFKKCVSIKRRLKSKFPQVFDYWFHFFWCLILVPQKKTFYCQKFFRKNSRYCPKESIQRRKNQFSLEKIKVPVKRKESNNKKNQFRANKTHLMLERKSKLVPAKN